MDIKERLFAGVYSTGIVYADKKFETTSGNYKQLGFLSFKDLKLDIEPHCPADLKSLIKNDAAKLQARKGEQYQISTAGQTITLGYALLKDEEALVEDTPQLN